jgi:hypothetical protein
VFRPGPRTDPPPRVVAHSHCTLWAKLRQVLRKCQPQIEQLQVHWRYHDGIFLDFEAQLAPHSQFCSSRRQPHTSSHHIQCVGGTQSGGGGPLHRFWLSGAFATVSFHEWVLFRTADQVCSGQVPGQTHRHGSSPTRTAHCGRGCGKSFASASPRLSNFRTTGGTTTGFFVILQHEWPHTASSAPQDANHTPPRIISSVWAAHRAVAEARCIDSG